MRAMFAPSSAVPRPQSLREETANALSHGLGFLLAVGSLPLAAEQATHLHRPEAGLGAGVFSVSMMLVYFASTVYHALPQGRAKRWFHRVDHAAIFVAIAGSFTPFALPGLRGEAGAAGFWLVWGLALLGVLVKAGGRLRCPVRSTLLYVALGCLALLAAWPSLQVVRPEGLVLIIGGGMAYMVGAGFFLADGRVRYAHFVWHLFVLTGSACHFAAAVRNVA